MAFSRPPTRATASALSAPAAVRPSAGRIWTAGYFFRPPTSTRLGPFQRLIPNAHSAGPRPHRLIRTALDSHHRASRGRYHGIFRPARECLVRGGPGLLHSPYAG